LTRRAKVGPAPRVLMRDEALFEAAVRHLSDGEVKLAVAYAWRATHRFAFEAEPHLLLGHCLEKAGATALASEAYATAMALDPRNTLTLSRYVQDLGRRSLARARMTLLDHLPGLRPGRNHDVTRLRQLFQDLRIPLAGACRVDGERVRGWVYYDAARPGELALEREVQGRDGAQTDLSPLRFRETGVTGFSFPWPDGGEHMHLRACLRLRGGASDTVIPLSGSPLFAPVMQQMSDGFAPVWPTASDDHVDVIVPVHDGFAHTHHCLQSVLSTLEGTGHRVIVIDDASTDSRLVGHLNALSAVGRITLLVNSTRLGFTASVNRGFALSAVRDVVVLNSDCVVHGDWLARLRRVAHASANVASVTPLSNNGQFLSYPEPDVPAPIPGPQDLAALDKAAARVNAGTARPIPAGIGYCLYLRRAALRDVGPFNAARFGHGYGEDIEFSLRAAAKGWRHLCATDVFVGHIGNASFGHAKAALAARNMQAIRARFPLYRATMAQFRRSDPLRAARRRLARAMAEADPQGGAGPEAVDQGFRPASGLETAEGLKAALAQLRSSLWARRKLIIFGETLDDAALMRTGRALVLGPVPAERQAALANVFTRRGARDIGDMAVMRSQDHLDAGGPAAPAYRRAG